MDAVRVYKKRIRKAVKGNDCCQYGRCQKCPYHLKGCKSSLYLESAELLSDYLVNLKGFCEDKAFEVPE